MRGPTYLKDKKKIPAGQAMFVFGSMDVIEVPHPVEHVARFLPSIRERYLGEGGEEGRWGGGRGGVEGRWGGGEVGRGGGDMQIDTPVSVFNSKFTIRIRYTITSFYL